MKYRYLFTTYSLKKKSIVFSFKRNPVKKWTLITWYFLQQFTKNSLTSRIEQLTVQFISASKFCESSIQVKHYLIYHSLK